MRRTRASELPLRRKMLAALAPEAAKVVREYLVQELGKVLCKIIPSSVDRIGFDKAGLQGMISGQRKITHSFHGSSLRLEGYGLD